METLGLSQPFARDKAVSSLVASGESFIKLFRWCSRGDVAGAYALKILKLTLGVEYEVIVRRALQTGSVPDCGP